jgi:hypothetical protein
MSVEGTKGRGKKGAGLRSVRSRDPLIVAEGGLLVTSFLVILREALNKSKALRRWICNFFFNAGEPAPLNGALNSNSHGDARGCGILC